MKPGSPSNRKLQTGNGMAENSKDNRITSKVLGVEIERSLAAPNESELVMPRKEDIVASARLASGDYNFTKLRRVLSVKLPPQELEERVADQDASSSKASTRGP